MSVRGKTRVFLVDDHPLVREWLTSLIAQQPDLTVCGEWAGAEGALTAIAAAKPDVAVVDLSLGDGSGLELIKALRVAQPTLEILVLSMHDEDFSAERALRAGARGYVMKREVAKNVVLAIRRVREGKLYVSERLAERLADRFVTGRRPAGASPVTLLSDRELEVFRLMGQGHSTRHVAEKMHVSAKTVQAYQARIKEKLGLESATELLREAIRWVEDEPGA